VRHDPQKLAASILALATRADGARLPA
jgi:hypothetical protein